MSISNIGDLTLTNSYAGLPTQFYSRVNPQPLAGSHCVSTSKTAAKLIGLNESACSGQALSRHFGDMVPLPGSEPLAMVYAGHQFGVYVPRLGDGRAILLGEVPGENGRHWDLHLKGAGKTPYSRSGDGRAVLRSVIREFLGSEYLHALGIPTTRALCVIGSDEPVWREQPETGATMLRLAHSHIRFGHFEYFHYTDDKNSLRLLADYVIDRHYPELTATDNRYAELFDRCVTSTAALIAGWQAWGFAHGVLNTDNMSILGETLDYGPYGLMDDYEPGWICNHSDSQGRYAWHRQPTIGLWNCAALAQAFSSLVPEQLLKQSLNRYEQVLTSHWLTIMRRRLGLAMSEDQDLDLAGRLLGLFQVHRCDYAISMRNLAPYGNRSPWCPLGEKLAGHSEFDDWAKDYSKRLEREEISTEQHRERIQAANPAFVLRNHLLQLAIDQACRHQGYDEVQQLLQLAGNPFHVADSMEEYIGPAPEWSKSLQVSCSS